MKGISGCNQRMLSVCPAANGAATAAAPAAAAKLSLFPDSVVAALVASYYP